MSGPFGVVAAPSGRFIYTPDIGAPQAVISGLSVDTNTGVLTQMSGSPFSTLIMGFPFSIAVHPSGKFFYANLVTLSSIEGWNIDSITGALTSDVEGSPFAVGSSPDQFISSIVIDPNGEFLYVSGPSGGIFGFRIDANNGVLTAMSGSPFRLLVTGQMVIDPSGQYMYAPFASAITGMSIDASTGELSLLSGSPFPTGGVLTGRATLAIAKAP
jgi:6-phosphogluconolactonase (cycloisomerase 2 family)